MPTSEQVLVALTFKSHVVYVQIVRLRIYHTSSPDEIHIYIEYMLYYWT